MRGGLPRRLAGKETEGHRPPPRLPLLRTSQLQMEMVWLKMQVGLPARKARPAKTFEQAPAGDRILEVGSSGFSLRSLLG